jgi:hypothetical protein
LVEWYRSIPPKNPLRNGLSQFPKDFWNWACDVGHSTRLIRHATPPRIFIPGDKKVLSKLISRIIVFAAVLALLAVGAITLSSKLPKPAAAFESIDPAIVTTHLQQLRGELALP